MKHKAATESVEPTAHGKKLSHWLRRIDVAASDTDHKLAEEALRTIGQQAVPALLSGLRRGGRDAQRAARGFRALGKDAAAAVSEIQSNPGPEPSFAAFALAGIGGQAFVALKSFLTHTEPMVRSAGAEGVGQALLDKCLSSAEAQEVLNQLVENTRDQHQHVRARSASTLGMIRSQPTLCVPALVENLSDHSSLVRYSAAQALGGFGREAWMALPKLHAAAKSPDGPERGAAVNSIAKIGLPEGYQAVVAALDDKDITVRAAAVNGLGYFPERAREVVPLLVGVLERDSSMFKWNALWALGRLGPLARDALPVVRRWQACPSEVGGEKLLRRAIEQIERRQPSETSKPNSL